MDAVGATRFGEAVALATSSPFGVGGARFHYSAKEERTDTTYMGAWHRSIFERIGLFDEELVRNQDDEFNYRLRAAGGKVLLCPQIKSEYTVRSTPRQLWQQYFQYGFWKARVLQKHPFQMRPRQFAPPAFVLALFAALIFLNLGTGWWPLILIAGMYLATNLCVSLYTSARHGWRHLPLLSVTYAILHLSYGFGFLIGLIKFIGLWKNTNSPPPALSHNVSERSLPPGD
jgi:hypothetical protein